MTKIKLCGLRRAEDIAAANELRPDFVGFVFAAKSRRYVPPEKAAELRRALAPGIAAVGVFADESPRLIAALLRQGVVDLAQLHGAEDEDDIARLRELTDRPLIKAFRIKSESDVYAAEHSPADFILLDAGAGEGKVFDWALPEKITRPYFLAGGLTPENVGTAIRLRHPFGVDVSSGIETNGKKDPEKMRRFVEAVRARAAE